MHQKLELTVAPRAWLLLSGGIDSAACLAFYLKQGFRVECFHINFGQAADLAAWAGKAKR